MDGGDLDRRDVGRVAGYQRELANSTKTTARYDASFFPPNEVIHFYPSMLSGSCFKRNPGRILRVPAWVWEKEGFVSLRSLTNNSAEFAGLWPALFKVLPPVSHRQTGRLSKLASRDRIAYVSAPPEEICATV